MDNNIVVSLKNVKKSYQSKDKIVNVFSGVNIEFEKGKFYVLMGHSGSGKSTLIKIIGMIETFEDGVYELYGKNIKEYNKNKIADLRMKNIGFVFQDFYLNKTLKAYENVMLPMLINKEINKKDRKTKAYENLRKIGIEDRAEHFPKELSGGEQQRVAIARALANNPDIILADEPTGNLDKKNEKIIFERLKKLSQEGKCVIVVSHSNEVKEYADIIFEIDDGNIIKI